MSLNAGPNLNNSFIHSFELYIKTTYLLLSIIFFGCQILELLEHLVHKVAS